MNVVTECWLGFCSSLLFVLLSEKWRGQRMMIITYISDGCVCFWKHNFVILLPESSSMDNQRDREKEWVFVNWWEYFLLLHLWCHVRISFYVKGIISVSRNSSIFFFRIIFIVFFGRNNLFVKVLVLHSKLTKHFRWTNRHKQSNDILSVTTRKAYGK